MGEMTASLRSALRADMPTAPRAVPGGAFPDILSLQPVIWPGFFKQGMMPIDFAAWPFAPGGLRLRPRHPIGNCRRMLQQVPGRSLRM
jgi:hypothetical protein